MRAFLLALIFLWSAIESIYGLTQVFGVNASRHAAFVLTGHFDNPGPYGGFIAITMSVSAAYLLKYRCCRKGWYRETLFILAALSFVLGILVLPASMSRTAWLALFLSVVILIASDKKIMHNLRQWKKWLMPSFVFLALVFGVMVFCIKPDSAIGRLHIWRIELLSMIHNPMGTGVGTALGTYGKEQELFFREYLGTVSDRVVRVAGCPEYPFNEFLGIGMEYGWMGMLCFVSLVLAVLFILHKRRSVLEAGLIAWCVFAMASYPLSVPQTSILFLFFVAAAIPQRKVPFLVNVILISCAVVIVSLSIFWGWYKDFRIIDRGLYRDLYKQGYSFYQDGEYAKSIEILERGAAISSDPVFHVVIGRCHEALGEYDVAEKEYIKAYYMVPCRIYPLVRLMRLKLKEGDYSQAMEVCQKIISIPVVEKHNTMMQLHEEVVTVRDSLLQATGEFYGE